MGAPKKYKLIACEIMFREICHCAAKCKNLIDITFMPKGLHDIGQSKMFEQLQNEIDKVDTEQYEAILLCYGLCNNGIKGLHASLPMVIPRAHDCITILLGSRKKYNDYFKSNSGTYYYSTGWIERNKSFEDEGNIVSQLGFDSTYQDYVEKYGEENAAYLMEMLGDWRKHYTKLAYIDTKTGEFPQYKALSKQHAEQYNWQYEELEGDTRLIFDLLEGNWDEENFLVVAPTHKVAPSNNESIISAVANREALKENN